MNIQKACFYSVGGQNNVDVSAAVYDGAKRAPGAHWAILLEACGPAAIGLLPLAFSKVEGVAYRHAGAETKAFCEAVASIMEILDARLAEIRHSYVSGTVIRLTEHDVCAITVGETDSWFLTHEANGQCRNFLSTFSRAVPRIVNTFVHPHAGADILVVLPSHGMFPVFGSKESVFDRFEHAPDVLPSMEKFEEDCEKTLKTGFGCAVMKSVH